MAEGCGPNPSNFMKTPLYRLLPLCQTVSNPTFSCHFQHQLHCSFFGRMRDCLFFTYYYYHYSKGPVDLRTRINIYLHHLWCAHSSYLYYIQWIIHWYHNKLLSTMSLLSNNYSLKMVLYLLIRCYKTRLFK